MGKRYLMLILCLVMASIGAMSQNKVSGVVLDEASGKSVPFVNVGLFRHADSVFVVGAATDEKGCFELEAVPDGGYRLRVSAIGYQTFEQPVEVEGDINVGALRLKVGTTTLDEVVIVEKRPLFAVEGEKTMYNVAEDPSIQTGTASDALQNAPGVQVDVEGNITLRGTSSVEVWINDKPSHMSAENLKTFIQQMPANSIDHVEVITNPSARYGSKADGIINIVTNAKVQKNQFVSYGANASTNPSVTPWVSYVWSNDKLTINAYANMGLSLWKGLSISEQQLYNEAQQLANHEIDSTRYSQKNYSTGGFLSLDYQIDTANSLNIWLNGWPNWGNNSTYASMFRDEFLPDTVNVSFIESGENKAFGSYVAGGLYYQHKFDNNGHILSASLNGTYWGYKVGYEVERGFTKPFAQQRTINQDDSSADYGVVGEVIYTRPYSKSGEVSVGLSSSYNPSISILVTDTLADTDLDIWANDAYRSYKNRCNNIDNEVFVTVQHKFGGFTLKPGLRLISELVSGVYPDSTQYNFSKHFFSLRPSLHLSYRTKSMHNLRASYTLRIASPDASQLSLFPMYNEDDYSIGNPELERIYTHNAEIGWTKYWDKFGSVGLTGYFRGKSNEVNNVTISEYHPLYGRVVPYSYPVNVGRSFSTGLEFNMMYRPTGFFNLRFYANVYDSYLKTEFEGQDYTSQLWTYSFRLNLWAKLWKRLEVTATGYYSSPTQSLFSQNHANYGINAGLRADFFDHMMSVFVNANDIFNWHKWGRSNNSPYVVSSSSTKFNTRSVSVGLTFRFGKMELEQRAKQGSDSGGAPQGLGM